MSGHNGPATLNRVNLVGNQASIREACDAGLLAGAVTVVWRHGEVLDVNEIGYRDVDAKLPIQRDTLFRIASMTKPVTVAAAMSLVDENKLALRDPIVRWLPIRPPT
jgi:CubicO group peptidase (beta-lactamase class C family)